MMNKLLDVLFDLLIAGCVLAAGYGIAWLVVVFCKLASDASFNTSVQQMRF